MKDVREFAKSIVSTLRGRGYQAYFVGGCVRDLLLGREPADYDVSTDATREQGLRGFPGTNVGGAQFGVVLVPVDSLLPDGAPSEHANAIEVGTFRSDGLYTDG